MQIVWNLSVHLNAKSKDKEDSVEDSDKNI